MTPKEAIDIIRYTFLNVDNHLNDGGTERSSQDIHDALVLACSALCNPSLPSNLDEAAEAHRRKVYYGDAEMCQFVREVFKAGAEWMEGQGQTFEAHVDNGCAIASGVKLPFVLWDTCEDGDLLKVQIRKKQ